MLKIRSEMLKIIKNVKIFNLGKIFQEFPNPGNPENFRSSPDFRKIFKKFSVSGKLKIREKEKP